MGVSKVVAARIVLRLNGKPCPVNSLLQQAGQYGG